MEIFYECPLCKEDGFCVQLKVYQINFSNAIYMCPTPKCNFPVGSDEIDKFIISRNFKEILSCKFKKCTQLEQPSITNDSFTNNVTSNVSISNESISENNITVDNLQIDQNNSLFQNNKLKAPSDSILGKTIVYGSHSASSNDNITDIQTEDIYATISKTFVSSKSNKLLNNAQQSSLNKTNKNQNSLFNQINSEDKSTLQLDNSCNIDDVIKNTISNDKSKCPINGANNNLNKNKINDLVNVTINNLSEDAVEKKNLIKTPINTLLNVSMNDHNNYHQYDLINDKYATTTKALSNNLNNIPIMNLNIESNETLSNYQDNNLINNQNYELNMITSNYLINDQSNGLTNVQNNDHFEVQKCDLTDDINIEPTRFHSNKSDDKRELITSDCKVSFDSEVIFKANTNSKTVSSTNKKNVSTISNHLLKNETNIGSMGLSFDLLDKFLLWPNKNALCWLDVVLSLITHNRRIKRSLLSCIYDELRVENVERLVADYLSGNRKVYLKTAVNNSKANASFEDLLLQVLNGDKVKREVLNGVEVKRAGSVLERLFLDFTAVQIIFNHLEKSKSRAAADCLKSPGFESSVGSVPIKVGGGLSVSSGVIAHRTHLEKNIVYAGKISMPLFSTMGEKLIDNTSVPLTQLKTNKSGLNRASTAPVEPVMSRYNNKCSTMIRNRPLVETAIANIRKVLSRVRDDVFNYLEVYMKCKRDVHDSPLIALTTLLEGCTKKLKSKVKRENGKCSDVEKRTVVDVEFKNRLGESMSDLSGEISCLEYDWTMNCSVCGRESKDSVKKEVPTFLEISMDFTMNRPYFLRTCFVCKAAKQKLLIHFKKLPNTFFIHFLDGLVSNDLTCLNIASTNGIYVATGLVQYRSTQSHFVTWLRRPENDESWKWMEYDDLKPDICTYEHATLSVPASEIHIVMWERIDLATFPELAYMLEKQGNTVSAGDTVSLNVSLADNVDVREDNLLVVSDGAMSHKVSVNGDYEDALRTLGFDVDVMKESGSDTVGCEGDGLLELSDGTFKSDVHVNYVDTLSKDVINNSAVNSLMNNNVNTIWNDVIKVDSIENKSTNDQEILMKNGSFLLNNQWDVCTEKFTDQRNDNDYFSCPQIVTNKEEVMNVPVAEVRDNNSSINIDAKTVFINLCLFKESPASKYISENKARGQINNLDIRATNLKSGICKTGTLSLENIQGRSLKVPVRNVFKNEPVMLKRDEERISRIREKLELIKKGIVPTANKELTEMDSLNHSPFAAKRPETPIKSRQQPAKKLKLEPKKVHGPTHSFYDPYELLFVGLKPDLRKHPLTSSFEGYVPKSQRMAEGPTKLKKVCFKEGEDCERIAVGNENTADGLYAKTGECSTVVGGPKETSSSCLTGVSSTGVVGNICSDETNINGIDEMKVATKGLGSTEGAGDGRNHLDSFLIKSNLDQSAATVEANSIADVDLFLKELLNIDLSTTPLNDEKKDAEKDMNNIEWPPVSVGLNVHMDSFYSSDYNPVINLGIDHDISMINDFDWLDKYMPPDL